MGLEVAVVVDEVGVRFAPVGGVDSASAVLDVGWNGGIVARPEPKMDLRGRPFGGIPRINL